MDNLDYWFHLLGLEVEVDAFCQLQSPFELANHDLPKGQIRFHFVLSGQAQLQTSQGSRLLQSGDFCLLTETHFIRQTVDCPISHTGVKHEQRPAHLAHVHNDVVGDPDLQMLCGYLKVLPELSSLFDFGEDYFVVNLMQYGALHSLADLVLAEAKYPQVGGSTIIHALCTSLFLYAIRHMQLDYQVQLPLLVLSRHATMAEVIRRVLQSPEQRFTLEELAHQACMSRATFAKQFKQLSGMGAQQFFRAIKMLTARHRLRTSSVTIAQLAYDLAYQSESAFIQAFERYFKQTPTQCRLGQGLLQKTTKVHGSDE